VFADHARMRAHPTSAEEFGDQGRHGRSDAVDLAQPTFGSQLFQRLCYAGDAPRGAAIRPQSVALLAGHLEALGDLFE
jgi:hypothetical protein